MTTSPIQTSLSLKNLLVLLHVFIEPLSDILQVPRLIFNYHILQLLFLRLLIIIIYSPDRVCLSLHSNLGQHVIFAPFLNLNQRILPQHRLSFTHMVAYLLCCEWWNFLDQRKVLFLLKRYLRHIVEFQIVVTSQQLNQVPHFCRNLKAVFFKVWIVKQRISLSLGVLLKPTVIILTNDQLTVFLKNVNVLVDVATKLWLLIWQLRTDHFFENSHFPLLGKQVVIVVYHHFFEYFVFLERNFHLFYENFVSLVMSPSGVFFHIAFTHCGGGSLSLFLFHNSKELHVFIEFFVSESFAALFSFPQVLIFGEGVFFFR